MARALRAWAINRRTKISVRNLRYGPQTRLVRAGIDDNINILIRLDKSKQRYPLDSDLSAVVRVIYPLDKRGLGDKFITHNGYYTWV